MGFKQYKIKSPVGNEQQYQSFWVWITRVDRIGLWDRGTGFIAYKLLSAEGEGEELVPLSQRPIRLTLVIHTRND